MASSRGKILWKRTLRPGMKGRDVAILQKHLAALNYYTAECDGLYGILTKDAVFDFQKAHRLRVDGIAGKEVFDLLKSGLERARVEHIVRSGETLSSIAGKYNVPLELLVLANNLKTEEVKGGESLFIPVSRLIGFCSPENPGEPVVSYEHILPSLTAVAPRWFSLDEHGNIQGAPDRRFIALTAMTGVELWPVISIGRCTTVQEGVEAQDMLHNILSDNTAYSTAIKSLSSLASRVRVEGLIISIGKLPEKDVYAFVSFLRKVSRAIKQEGLLLAVEIPLPDETTFRQTGDHRGCLKELGDIASTAHQVFFRAYKEPSEFSSPGPAISVNCTKTVLRSLTRVVDFWKLIIVVPAFGVDFSAGLGAAPLRKKHSEIMEITDLFKPTVSQLDDEKSKVFRYRSFRVSHTVYFEDAQSIGAYADLALRYGLAGIAIADLGDVDPWVWSTLKARFKVVRGAVGS